MCTNAGTMFSIQLFSTSIFLPLDSYLRKAFVQIAQVPYIVSDWKFLGRQLDVQEMDISQVDEGYSSMREKCYYSLIKWREMRGIDATPALLITTLRKCKYQHVAG